MKKKQLQGRIPGYIINFSVLVTLSIVLMLTKNLFYSFGGAITIFIAFAVFNSIRQMNEIQKVRNSGISEVDTMDGFQFEHYLVELFKSEGFSAVRTPDSGDFGADVILKKEGKKIVVQAKRYRSNVGIKAVQEVIGALNYYKADEAWVVTNSDYTKAAKKLAIESNVRLVNRDELVTRMNLLTKNECKPDPAVVKIETAVKEIKKCPDCGNSMVLRNSKNGVFYGCSTFPKCTGIRQTV